MSDAHSVAHPSWREYPLPEMIERARAFNTEIQRRRTVREFSARLVPREIIEHCLLAAGRQKAGAPAQSGLPRLPATPPRTAGLHWAE